MNRQRSEVVGSLVRSLADSPAGASDRSLSNGVGGRLTIPTSSIVLEPRALPTEVSMARSISSPQAQGELLLVPSAEDQEVLEDRPEPEGSVVNTAQADSNTVNDEDPLVPPAEDPVCAAIKDTEQVPKGTQDLDERILALLERYSN